MKNAVKVCEKCGGKMVQMYSDDRCVEEQYICVECAYATPKTKIKGFIKAVRKQSSRDHIKKKDAIMMQGGVIKYGRSRKT